MTGMSASEHRAAYKKPGMTLAESLGLAIPDDAPGGQPMVSPAVHLASGASERARRGSEIRDAGFYDLDAYGRADL